MAGGDARRDFPGPSAGDIADMLRPHAEALGRMIFPAATMSGGFLCIGSLHGEPGDSLKIQTRGPKAGTWADYATSDSDPAGKGDMLKLLQLTLGAGDIKRGIAEAKRYLNLDSMDPRALERVQLRAAKARDKAVRDKADDDERKRRQAEGLWQSAAVLTPGSPAVQYLAGRGIRFGDDSPLPRPPGSLRFHPKVWHAELRREVPAMVACFLDLGTQSAGPRIVAAHVTYLEYRATSEGSSGWMKLGGVERRKIIRGPLYWGGHIPVWKGTQSCTLAKIAPGTAIEASEGIEDGLSFALANPRARVVAGGTLGNLGQMRLPPQAGDLTLLAQNDSKPEPIQALEDALRKQQQQAREQASTRVIGQRRPPQGIKDWNDWQRAGEAPEERNNAI